MIDSEIEAPLVRVWLLGPFYAERREGDGSWKPIEKQAWEGSYARPLLLRLLCATARRATRSTLLDDLWPETPLHLAEKYLNNAASKLRQILHKEMIKPIGPHGTGGYQLGGQLVLWTDSDACDTLLAEAERPDLSRSQAMLLLEQACQQFERGEMLEGESGQWCHALRSQREAALRYCRLALAQHYEAQGRLWQARSQYHKLLEANPVDEDALCRFLPMLHRHGMNSDLRAVFEEAKKRFKEYGIPLSESTQELVKHLMRDSDLEMYLTPFLVSASSRGSITPTLASEKHGIIEEASNRRESQHMDELRRQILEQLLGGASALFLPPLLSTEISSLTVSPITTEDFLMQCSASLQACWYLLRGKGLGVAEDILTTYLPSLAKLTFKPSPYQETAAGLATQAKILQAILAMHKLNFAAREMYCQEAVHCSQLSVDGGLKAAAHMYLAYTYIYCLPRRPEKAVPLFLEALRDLGSETSLLRSDIYMGLADAYAQCKEENKALETIDQAHQHFPKYPEQDPRYLYADCGWFELHSDTGKMYLDLAHHYPDRDYFKKAYEIFTELAGSQSSAERTTNEMIIRQADAARGLSDLFLYADSLEKGALMALSLGSQKRYSEAYDVFQRTPEHWRGEKAIKRLARDVFHQLPERRAQQ